MTYTATITQKGQVTIPVAIRNSLGLQASSKLIFSIDNENILAQPVKSDFLSLYGSLKTKNKKPADLKKIRQIIRKTLFVDTNVFLRFLLNDHKTQSPAANKLFKEAGKGKITLTTSSLIMAEMVFTLDSFYKLSKQEIIKKVHAILFFEGLKITEKNILIQAITFYEKKNIDFIDAYGAAFALENKIDICSFDRDFDRVKEIKRFNPII